MKFNQKEYQRGQNLLEFALIITVLLLLIVVIFDLGRVVYFYSLIHNAAREGARTAILSPESGLNFTAINGAAERFIFGLDPSAVSVSATTLPDTSDLDGDGNTTEVLQARVTVTFTFRPATPLVQPFLGPSNTITLRSSSTMRMEHTY